MRVARSIVLSEEQRDKLRGYARGRSIAKRVVERARIVLQAAEGKQDLEIAANLQIGRHTVARWRARFLESSIAGIEKDAARPGRMRTIEAQRIVQKTT
jgi:transposase